MHENAGILIIFTHQKNNPFKMKKSILIIIALAFSTILITSCAGSRQGMGCPTSGSNKPFRA
jgi:predicted small secreted protein